MSTTVEKQTYLLGNSGSAEYRLQLLNEITNQRFIQSLGVLPKNGMRVLIIGCGSGHLEATISTLFQDSSFQGIDISAQRIQESEQRMKGDRSSNSFQYLERDITTISMEELGEFDIIISRFVLSHLSEPETLFTKLHEAVRPGGFICLHEIASNGSEYKSYPVNEGYNFWVELVNQQVKDQNCKFDIGNLLLQKCMQLGDTIHHSYLETPVLYTARTKSIMRLGIEDAKAHFIKNIAESRMESGIQKLKEFENDDHAFGFYTEIMAVIAQKPA